MDYEVCRYCGQSVMIENDPNDKRSNGEQAVMNCECEEATNYKERLARIRKAKKDIKRIFTDETDKVIEFLSKAVEMCIDSEFESIAAELDWKTKAKISCKSDGNIKIERTDTVKSNAEI